MNTSDTGGGIDSGSGAGGRSAGWTDDVERFAHEERLDAAAQRRRQERWQHERRHDEITTAATLSAARDRPVGVVLCTGAELHGTVLAVGLDVVELATTQGTTWVSLDALDAVLVEQFAPGEDRRDDLALADVVEALRGEREAVTVTLRSGAVLAGEVVAAGASVVLALGSATRRAVVRPGAIAAVSR